MYSNTTFNMAVKTQSSREEDLEQACDARTCQHHKPSEASCSISVWRVLVTVGVLVSLGLQGYQLGWRNAEPTGVLQSRDKRFVDDPVSFPQVSS